MFPLEAATSLPLILGAEPWSLLGAVSFEPRWRGAADLLRQKSLTPESAWYLFPIDRDSRYEKECGEIQEAAWRTFNGSGGWQTHRENVDLLGSPVWETAVGALAELVREGGGGRVVIDMSTMPKICLFPIVKKALESPEISSVIVVYTKPVEYHDGLLHSEPVGTTIIPGFDQANKDQDCAGWIPIMGFSGAFVAIVYEALVESYKLEGRIFPLLGFPAFDPLFFERAFREGCHSMFRSQVNVTSRLLYSAAFDPFETRREIIRLIDSAPSDIQWFGSPLGAKPMGLGMLLACLERKITIVTCQVRSYHPKYSSGVGDVQAYLLKENGRLCYRE